MTNWERYTVIFGFILFMWMTKFPLEGEHGNIVMIHQCLATGHASIGQRAIYYILEFLIISVYIAFAVMAFMGKQKHLLFWTMLAGYVLLGFALCQPFSLFATLEEYPKKTGSAAHAKYYDQQVTMWNMKEGHKITKSIFLCLFWIMIAVWHILVGHKCCAHKPEDDEDSEDGKKNKKKGCCGAKPKKKKKSKKSKKKNNNNQAPGQFGAAGGMFNQNNQNQPQNFNGPNQMQNNQNQQFNQNPQVQMSNMQNQQNEGQLMLGAPQQRAIPNFNQPQQNQVQSNQVSMRGNQQPVRAMSAQNIVNPFQQNNQMQTQGQNFTPSQNVSPGALVPVPDPFAQPQQNQMQRQQTPHMANIISGNAQQGQVALNVSSPQMAQ